MKQRSSVAVSNISKGVAPKRMEVQYMSKELAARRLNMSVRRLLELAKEGKIKHKRVLDPVTKRKQLVLLAADIEQRASQAPLPGVSATPTELSRMYPSLFPPEPDPEPAPEPKLWLTLKEAEALVQLPHTVLRRLIRNGKLRALDVGVRKDGQYRIKRSDLEELTGEDCSQKKRAARQR